MRILACRTAYGQGGLGQHFAQLVEESRTAGELLGYFAHTIKAGDESIGRTIDYVRLNRLKKYSPLRFFPTVVTRMGEDIFDRRVENALQRKSDRFMGFVGKSLFSFQRARSLGTEHLELVAANSHVRNVQRLHQLAAQTHGIRDTWLGEGLARKTEAEYETADAIYVHSNYTHRSLVQEGIPESKLVRTVLEVDQRFRPGTGRIDDAITRVVYTGRLDATKGVPLIREAMRRMPDEQIELTLVGAQSGSLEARYLSGGEGSNFELELVDVRARRRLAGLDTKGGAVGSVRIVDRDDGWICGELDVHARLVTVRGPFAVPRPSGRG